MAKKNPFEIVKSFFSIWNGNLLPFELPMANLFPFQMAKHISHLQRTFFAISSFSKIKENTLGCNQFMLLIPLLQNFFLPLFL